MVNVVQPIWKNVPQVRIPSTFLGKHLPNKPIDSFHGDVVFFFEKITPIFPMLPKSGMVSRTRFMNFCCHSQVPAEVKNLWRPSNGVLWCIQNAPKVFPFVDDWSCPWVCKEHKVIFGLFAMKCRLGSASLMSDLGPAVEPSVFFGWGGSKERFVDCRITKISWTFPERSFRQLDCWF